MSVAMSHQIGSAAFVLLTRLFAGLKRSGRVIDVIWFQQNPEYARAVLVLAGQSDHEAVREIGINLEKLLGDFLKPPQVAAVAVIDVQTTDAAGGGAMPAASGIDPNRYIGRLR